MQSRKRVDHAAVELEGLWAHHHAELRDPHQVVSQWRQATDIDPRLLEYRVRGAWWQTLDAANLTLFVTREYEHLAMAFSMPNGRRRISFLHLPHPNGMATDATRRRLYIASTRNPNVVFDFAPCTGGAPGSPVAEELAGQLLPTRARYLPGRLYIHDLARIGDELYANAVGLNAVVKLDDNGGFEPVWWPRSIDGWRGPRFDKNYLQLNSIAPAATVAESYFSASAEAPSARRPGHLNFPVDRRGVIFAGDTRAVYGRGLTRPHSARIYRGEVWVDNSGYGELGRIVDGVFEPVVKLGGWTRGLLFHGDLAFVGTSRIIPRFRHYAPGLDPDHCETGLHAIHLPSGRVLGSMLWPAGNQIFAIEGLDRRLTSGFPFVSTTAAQRKRQLALFSRGVAA